MIDNILLNEYFKLRDRIIENEFKHLDNEQKKAVLEPDKNTVILACPGSGKTTVLINRALYLIKYGEIYNTNYFPSSFTHKDLDQLRIYAEMKESGQRSQGDEYINNLWKESRVNPNNIIVITFTKAAAQNMKVRFQGISSAINSPFFGTMHGLFYKILSAHFGRIDIIETSTAYKIISNILVMYVNEISDEKIKEIRNSISLFKCSKVSIDNFNSPIDKSIFIKCYEAYENYKKQKGLLDFDDLQNKCRELFLTDTKILEHYRKLFKFILVDEFQDCDHIQMDILKLLNENSSLFAVGDEDQCIYSFRGSRPDYMVEFDLHFKEGKKYFLSTNYRSTENIVGISSNLIKNNICRNDKKMTSFKKEKKLLDVLRYKDENTQAEDIALRIEKLKLLNCCEYKDTAVLYRTNMESRSLIDAFFRKKIPFKLLDKEYNFFEHFICKDIIAYLKLSIIGDDIESFIRIINKPFRYISKITLEKLRSSVFKENCFDAIKQMEGTPVFQMKNLDKLQKQINSLNKMSLMSALQYITTDLGYHDYVREYCLKFKIDINELENILEELKEAAKPFNSIATFLAHVEHVCEEFEKNARKSRNENCVILSTIHGVKGMEFKNVFIINCVEEIIPHINSIDTHLEEERRLFFVAVTRAMDNIFICIPENIRGKRKESSRFIEECKINPFQHLQDIYKAGDNIYHNSFGKGQIISLDRNIVQIMFMNNILRKFDILVLHSNGLIKRLEE